MNLGVLSVLTGNPLVDGLILAVLFILIAKLYDRIDKRWVEEAAYEAIGIIKDVNTNATWGHFLNLFHVALYKAKHRDPTRGELKQAIEIYHEQLEEEVLEKSSDSSDPPS